MRADLESLAYLTPSYPATLAEGQSLAFPFSNLPLYGNTTNAFGNYAKGSLEYTMGDRARIDVKFYDSALDAVLGNAARTVTLARPRRSRSTTTAVTATDLAGATVSGAGVATAVGDGTTSMTVPFC